MYISKTLRSRVKVCFGPVRILSGTTQIKKGKLKGKISWILRGEESERGIREERNL